MYCEHDGDDDDNELEWNEKLGKREFKDLYQKTYVDTMICLIPARVDMVCHLVWSNGKEINV
jgi:hypothetical protein